LPLQLSQGVPRREGLRQNSRREGARTDRWLSAKCWGKYWKVLGTKGKERQWASRREAARGEEKKEHEE